MWIATQSTREKRYALLTMPDFSQQPSLLDKPVVTYASGFGHTPYEGLRTDRFAGQLVQPLAVVDLTGLAVASPRSRVGKGAPAPCSHSHSALTPRARRSRAFAHPTRR